MKGNNSRNVSLLLASLVVGIGMVTSATIATAAPYAGGWKITKDGLSVQLQVFRMIIVVSPRGFCLDTGLLT